MSNRKDLWWISHKMKMETHYAHRRNENKNWNETNHVRSEFFSSVSARFMEIYQWKSSRKFQMLSLTLMSHCVASTSPGCQSGWILYSPSNFVSIFVCRFLSCLHFRIADSLSLSLSLSHDISIKSYFFIVCALCRCWSPQCVCVSGWMDSR